ncbi:MAG TPA: hypothetical protein EYP98_05390 [Planctomycetes bacterium]|nr:hypothetical protein [Planctomycetota bacterium]
MTRCAGRDGTACEFSTHQIGTPAWVRAPAVRCVLCDEPSRLHHLIASDAAQDVWSTLARLMILDQDVFSAALLRIPQGERQRAREQARRAACGFVPVYPYTRMHQCTLFHMTATNSLLHSATELPDLRRSAWADAQTLRHLGFSMRRLPPSVTERVFSFGARLDLPRLRSDLARVKQTAYNLGGHPLFWAMTSGSDLPPQEALVESYRLGFIVHQQGLQRLLPCVTALLLAADRASCHVTARAVTKVMNLMASMR